MSNRTQIPHPASLNFAGNVTNEWKRFRSQWQNYEIATDLVTETTDKRAAILLACIGSEAYELVQTFELSETDSRKVEKVIEAFDRHFVGQINVTYERYIFNRRIQETGETFNAFFSEIRKLVRSCEYSTLEESILRDRIVIGIKDDSTKKKLLQTRNLDLRQAIDICKSSELASKQLIDIVSRTDQEVQYIHNRDRAITKHGSTSSNRNPDTKRYRRSPNRDQSSSGCQYCGEQHRRARDACPAYGRTCRACDGKNHFASVCRKKLRGKPEVRSLESDEEILALDRDKDKRAYSRLHINGHLVRFLLDSGATVNLLPIDVVKRLNMLDKMHTTSSGLHMFDGTMLKIAGVVKLTVKHPITK